MNKKTLPYLLIIILLASCSQSIKMQHYNDYKKQITKQIFKKFENFLPNSFDQSLMSDIRYAPSFKALHCSGIDVLYSLDYTSFEKNLKKLYDHNIVPVSIFNDSFVLNEENSEYLSLIYNHQKIAIPRMETDFCDQGDTCLKWYDLETVILQISNEKVFTKNVDIEYVPENPICNYSIGAFISKQKKEIIYWFLVYN